VYISRTSKVKFLFSGCMAISLALSGCAGAPTRATGSGESSRASSEFDDVGPASELSDLQLKADLAYGEGRLLDAEQLYRRMLKASPSNGHAWMRLGNVQLRNDQLEAAVYAYRQCLRFETGDSRCWQNLSLTYVEMAVATLDQADGKASDEQAKERMVAFKRRLIESVNIESNSAR
jgi:tetratricopeptide (TPR) repeat protein